jgi:glutathione S-transferase
MHGTCRPGKTSVVEPKHIQARRTPAIVRRRQPCGAPSASSPATHLEDTMIKVYGGPRTRALVIFFYLEELGIPYERVVVNLWAGEQHKPEFRAINPIGKVPALVDGDTKVWESGAILLYLAEKYGNAPKTLEGRLGLYCWIMYANATLTPPMMENRHAHVMRVVEPLDDVLADRKFLLGDELTAADVAVGGMTAWSALALRIDYSGLPNVASYLRRLAERPAFQKTIPVAA